MTTTTTTPNAESTDHRRGRRRRVLGGSALAAVTVAAALGAVQVGQASAAPFQVKWTGGMGVTMRTAPSTGAERILVVPEGAGIEVQCQTNGTVVNGHPRWDRIVYGGRVGFISDYFTNTPSTIGQPSPGIAECGEPTVTPTPAPTSPAEAAARWAEGQVGNAEPGALNPDDWARWSGYCESFVARAYQGAV